VSKQKWSKARTGQAVWQKQLRDD